MPRHHVHGESESCRLDARRYPRAELLGEGDKTETVFVLEVYKSGL